jgi:hypothetical protein
MSTELHKYKDAPEAQETRMPSEQVLAQATKLAILNDKPIMLDYWVCSLESADPRVMIVIRKNEEKILLKSPEEYTSPIIKVYKVGSEYIVETENSLYVVLASIKIKGSK